MDVLLHQGSVFELPSSRRVGAIVHDGASDLRLWPAPGADRDLSEAWGPGLQEALDKEAEPLDGDALPIGGMLRVHRGRLHCDFLLWIASRPPEDNGVQAPAPSVDLLKDAVRNALSFVAERNVVRVAFGALGAGPDEAAELERLVAVAQASQAYYDDRFREGQPPVLEEVLVCHKSAATIREARKRLGKSVKALAPEPKPAAEKPKRKASTRKKKAPSKAKQVTLLTEDEVASARASASTYDRALTYSPGDFFIHPKFGVGRVESLTPEGYIMVLFEAGDTRRLLHARG